MCRPRVRKGKDDPSSAAPARDGLPAKIRGAYFTYNEANRDLIRQAAASRLRPQQMPLRKGPDGTTLRATPCRCRQRPRGTDVQLWQALRDRKAAVVPGVMNPR